MFLSKKLFKWGFKKVYSVKVLSFLKYQLYSSMLTIRPLISDGEPILGEAIQLEIIGKGSGILYGAPWLKVESRELKLSAKKFTKAVVFRNLPVSLKLPDLPSLSRRPRLVKGSEVVKLVLDKPVIRLTLISLPSFKKFVVFINPKGVVTNSPGVRIYKPTINSSFDLKPRVKVDLSRKKYFPGLNNSLLGLNSNLNLSLKLTPKKIKLIQAPSSSELVNLKNQKKC
jgi:hypothetical protein